MNALKVCHGGYVDDRFVRDSVAQGGEKVCATRENRSTRLSERLDSFLETSGPQIQEVISAPKKRTRQPS
jgi:hypothetical protein